MNLKNLFSNFQFCISFGKLQKLVSKFCTDSWCLDQFIIIIIIVANLLQLSSKQLVAVLFPGRQQIKFVINNHNHCSYSCHLSQWQQCCCQASNRSYCKCWSNQQQHLLQSPVRQATVVVFNHKVYCTCICLPSKQQLASPRCHWPYEHCQQAISCGQTCKVISRPLVPCTRVRTLEV